MDEAAITNLLILFI